MQQREQRHFEENAKKTKTQKKEEKRTAEDAAQSKQRRSISFGLGMGK